MRTLFTAILLLGLPAALGAQTARPAAPRTAGAAAITLAPGDALRITVWRNEELSCECTVAADGSLVHPLYRGVRVSGAPIDAVEARLREFLQQFETRPQFVIQPLVRVAVGGEVARPDLYLLPADMTVPEALAHAGGPTERGRSDRVLLLRSHERMRLNLSGARPADLRVPIRSGDQLVIERRHSLFRDLIAPVLTVVGSAAAVASVVIRAR